jgi:hypothetical protein
MVSTDKFRQLALAFEEAVEQPHFEKTSFRINKKIFATLDLQKKRAVLKFTSLDQSVFCAFDKTIIYPLNGTWGKQGWTAIELGKIRTYMLKDALTTAYCSVAPKRLAGKYRK